MSITAEEKHELLKTAILMENIINKKDLEEIKNVYDKAMQRSTEELERKLEKSLNNRKGSK